MGVTERAGSGFDSSDDDPVDGQRAHGRAARSADLRLRTLSLRTAFLGEHLPPERNMVFPGRQVTYLQPEEREAYRLHVDEHGLLRDAEGNLFDTTDGRTLHTPWDTRAIFVMDGDGNLYASKRHVAGVFQHSSLLAGQPVAGAGELRVRAGRLELVSNRSHHYMPPPDYLIQTVRHMVYGLGVTVDDETQLETVEWLDRGE